MYRRAYVQVNDGPRVSCVVPEGLAIREEDQCVIDVHRMPEIGRVLRLESVDGEPTKGLPVKVLRRATLQDQAKADENALRARIAADTCRQKAEKYKLEIRMVRVRYNFDQSMLEVLFAAEERMDIREMVKELTGELRTRVDMKQIGVRDEAKIMGGIGTCGRELCCCTWLRAFESINVRMAKTQGLSLNPSAISGNCGRLKCCLNYEFENYKAQGRGVARHGSRVRCPDGEGDVVDRNILGRRVKVRLSEGRVLEYDAAEVREV